MQNGVKKYDRKEKLDEYLEKTKKYISKKTYLKILSLYNILIKNSKKNVIAHGDLVPTNIMLDNDSIKFIDIDEKLRTEDIIMIYNKKFLSNAPKKFIEEYINIKIK